MLMAQVELSVPANGLCEERCSIFYSTVQRMGCSAKFSCVPACRRPIQRGNFVQHAYRAVMHKHSGERRRVKQALGNGLKVRQAAIVGVVNVVMDYHDLLRAAPDAHDDALILTRTQIHLHQPWRLDRCDHSCIWSLG